MYAQNYFSGEEVTKWEPYFEYHSPSNIGVKGLCGQYFKLEQAPTLCVICLLWICGSLMLVPRALSTNMLMLPVATKNLILSTWNIDALISGDSLLYDLENGDFWAPEPEDLEN